MKKFILEVAQNGGEYYGYTTIKGHSLEAVDNRKVIVDGVEISFDEYINEIKTIVDPKPTHISLGDI